MYISAEGRNCPDKEFCSIATLFVFIIPSIPNHASSLQG